MSNERIAYDKKDLHANYLVVSSGLFKAAFEHEYQHKLPQWLIGKKLGHLQLTIQRDRRNLLQDFPLPQITTEKYIGRVAMIDLIQDTEVNEQNITARIESNFVQHQVMRYGEKHLDDYFQISGLPYDLLYSNYTAITTDENIKYRANRQIKKSSTTSILNATDFSEKALSDYVNSTVFENNSSKRLFDSLITTTEGTEYSHKWELLLSVNVDINGHESETFLEELYIYLTKLLHRQNNRLATLNNSTADYNAEIEDLKFLIDKLATKIKFVRKILTQKNDRK